MGINGFDHVAIPVADLDAMLAFYTSLGCRIDDSHAPHLYAAHFGANKINFHAPRLWQSGKFDLRGPTAKPGCGDFCFVWSDSQAALDACLASAGAAVIEGPVARVGGRNEEGTSTYVRDPDGNLLEFIRYSGI
jgi:catechol 2,3-dioxygenase-like lactoylglutathione lyase family enzyme